MKANTKHKIMLRKYMKKTPSPIGFVSEFITGMSLIWPASPRDYIDPTGGGFAEDAKLMRADFENLAKDMQGALKKYEQTEAN